MKAIWKPLRKVKLDKYGFVAEEAYLPTGFGPLRIEGINTRTWEVYAGGRTWACHPNTQVVVIVKEKKRRSKKK